MLLVNNSLESQAVQVDDDTLVVSKMIDSTAVGTAGSNQQTLSTSRSPRKYAKEPNINSIIAKSGKVADSYFKNS